MELKSTKKQVVEEVEYGMYVWVTPEGEMLGDGDGNVMNVFCMEKKHRQFAKKAIEDAAHGLGESGRAVWLSGRRPIDDDQLAYQIERASQGQTPDPFDIAGIMAEAKELGL